MRRAVLLAVIVFAMVWAQTVTITAPLDGKITSAPNQVIIYSFTSSSSIDPSTIVLYVGGVAYDVADSELVWSAPNLIFTPSSPFAEGTVVCSLASAQTWSGGSVAGIPYVSRFFVDLTGPTVIGSGLYPEYSTSLPATVTNIQQAGQWWVADTSDMDIFTLEVKVHIVDVATYTYHYGDPGLIWEGNVIYEIVGTDTIFADRIIFDPAAAGISYPVMSEVRMELTAFEDAPDYGSPNTLEDRDLNRFYFFVDALGPFAERVSPLAPRNFGLWRTSCADQQFVFDVEDQNGLNVSSLQVTARGLTFGYGSPWLQIDTVETCAVIHFFVADTFFHAYFVTSTYGWASRVSVLNTYISDGCTVRVVRINTPLHSYAIQHQMYIENRMNAVESTAAMAGSYPGTVVLLEAEPYYNPVGYFGGPTAQFKFGFLENPWDTVGCPRSYTYTDSLYLYGVLSYGTPAHHIFDTIVSAPGFDTTQASLICKRIFCELGLGGVDNAGRVPHPILYALDHIVVTKIRVTYTPSPQLVQGEMLNYSLIQINDVFGNPVENAGDISWSVSVDRSAPVFAGHQPEHGAIITNPYQPITIRLLDVYGAVAPQSIHMMIDCRLGSDIVIDTVPYFDGVTYSWDGQYFTYTPTVPWVQGDTITVIFYNVHDSIDFCNVNMYSDEYSLVTWVMYVPAGPILMGHTPLNNTFSACPTQQISFWFWDQDGIDERSVLLRVEGKVYSVDSTLRHVQYIWFHTGPTDSIIVDSIVTIVHPLQYLGDGAFVFNPPQGFYVNAQEINCEILQAKDLLGNDMWYTGDRAWRFVMDLTPPYYWGVRPAPGSWAPNNNLVIAVSGDDSVSGSINPFSILFQIAGHHYGMTEYPHLCTWDGITFTFNATGAGYSFPDGATVNVCLTSLADAVDYTCMYSFGNQAVGLPYCWSFRVDNAPPLSVLIEPLDNTITACPTQQVKIRITDNVGLDTSTILFTCNGYVYTIDSPELSMVGDTLVFTPSTPWNHGQNVLFSLARVGDVAGNILSGSPIIGHFKVDLSAPTVIYTSPISDEILTRTLREIVIGIRDDSPLDTATARFRISVIHDSVVDTYTIAFASGLIDVTTSGSENIVRLDVDGAGIFLPPTGADVEVNFSVEDNPGYVCPVANILDYTYNFSITPGWRLPMVADIDDPDTLVDLVIGASLGASDGYDPGLDIPELPLPDTIYLPSFIIDGGAMRLIVDIRDLESEIPSWAIWTGSCAGTLWWNPANLPPSGTFIINGYVDMRMTDHYVFGPAEAIFINFAPNFIHLVPGWNLVSVPVTPDDPTPANVFRVPSDFIWWYDPVLRNFVHPTAIRPGYAYFVFYFGATETWFGVAGDPVFSYTLVNLPKGWCTIGSVYDFGGVDVSSEHVRTTPADAIWGGVYDYDATSGAFVYGYRIVAGHGYWVYINPPSPFTGADLYVESSWMKSVSAVEHPEKYNAEKSATIDVSGKKFTIAQQNNSTTGLDADIDILLPPPMPNETHIAHIENNGVACIRDVRPTSDGWTFVLNDGATVSTDVPLLFNTTLVSGSKWLPAGTYKVSFAGAAIPRVLALYENVPNPFNAATEIAFDLPEKASVRLEIFNILGRKVATLADGEFPAGSHSVIWDGTDASGKPAPAGIYFYKLDAMGNEIIRKMVFAK